MRIVVPFAALLTACYPEPPAPRHPVNLPDIVPGTEMDPEVKTEEHEVAVKNHECHTEYVDVNGKPGETLRCNDVATGETKTVTTEHLEVDYGGEALTRGQIYAMTDRDHERTWQRYDELRSSCKSHQLPRTIAGGMITGAALFIPLGESIIPDGQTRFYAAAGTMAAAAVIYTIGYFTGGSVCFDAHAYGAEHGITGSDDVKFDTGEESARIGKLVQQFNQSHVANE